MKAAPEKVGLSINTPKKDNNAAEIKGKQMSNGLYTDHWYDVTVTRSNAHTVTNYMKDANQEDVDSLKTIDQINTLRNFQNDVSVVCIWAGFL